MDVIQRETLETILMKSFDHSSHSDALMNALVEELHRRPAVAQEPSEPMSRTTKRKTETWRKFKDDEHTDPLSSETKLSLKACDDISMGQGCRRPCNKNKSRESSSRQKGRKSKKAQLSSSFLIFSDNEPVHTTAKENSGFELFDHND